MYKPVLVITVTGLLVAGPVWAQTADPTGTDGTVVTTDTTDTGGTTDTGDTGDTGDTTDTADNGGTDTGDNGDTGTPPPPPPPEAGAFDDLSKGNQIIAQALFDSQQDATDPLTLDQVAAAKDGTGWGEVFKQLKKAGLVQDKNLGQVVRKFRTGKSFSLNRNVFFATTANGKIKFFKGKKALSKLNKFVSRSNSKAESKGDKDRQVVATGSLYSFLGNVSGDVAGSKGKKVKGTKGRGGKSSKSGKSGGGGVSKGPGGGGISKGRGGGIAKFKVAKIKVPKIKKFKRAKRGKNK